MTNELKHTDPGVSLTKAEYEATTAHIANSQARGDILISDTGATGFIRLAKGAQNTVLVMGANDPGWSATLAGLTLTSPAINGTITTTGLTMPAFTAGGDISLGANKLRTTDLLLKQVSSTRMILHNAADTTPMDLLVRYLYMAYWHIMSDRLMSQGAGGSIEAKDQDAATLLIKARDTGVGLVEIARMVGAADPEFQLGNSGNALRSSYAGLLGFFATAPQAKPTGVAVTAAGIHAALVTLGLIGV